MSIAYDDLAYLIKKDQLRVDFVNWLSDQLEDPFLSFFFLETEESKPLLANISEMANNETDVILQLETWMEIEVCVNL